MNTWVKYYFQRLFQEGMTKVDIKCASQYEDVTIASFHYFSESMKVSSAS